MPQQPKWPFGRFAGRRVRDVPTWYLRWAVANCDLRGWIGEAARCVLDGRPLPLTDEEEEKRVHKIVRPWKQHNPA